MDKLSVLAFDIGASSGRAILGFYSEQSGLTQVEEIYRVTNRYVHLLDGVYWDHMRIYDFMLESLRICKKRDIIPDCIGIDTWAEDYAYIGSGGDVLGQPRCYRDPSILMHANDYELDTGKKRMDHALHSGASFNAISSFRQLWLDQKTRRGLFDSAAFFLYMPYLFVYLLTGKVAYDLSLPSIGEQCNAADLKYSDETARVLGVLEKTPPLVRRGDIIGHTNEAVFLETGLKSIPVACIDAHDTASAVSAIPDSGEFLWVSSGSYNMYGVVLKQAVVKENLLEAGYTNTPLGDGRICIMGGGGSGMYYMQRCIKEWCDGGMDLSYRSLEEFAGKNPTGRYFDFSDLIGTEQDIPAAIRRAIQKAGGGWIDTPFEMYEAYCNSMAILTSTRLAALEAIIGKKFDNIYVVSGGSQSDAINQRLSNQMKREVSAGLVEAAAMGNILSQLYALGIKNDIRVSDNNYQSLVNMRRFNSEIRDN